MAHGITAKDTMISVREKPWHGLGIIIQEALTSEEAIKMANLDWNVEAVNMYYGKNQVGSKKAINVKANVRMDTGDILGIVTDHYKIVQNKEGFAFTDALLDNGAKFETAGSLWGGKTVWMLAKMPEWELLGDKMEDYLCFSNSHDGKGAVHINATKIRVVCNNTLNLSLSTASRQWTGKHMGDMKTKYAEASRCLNMNHQYKEALKVEAETLANTSISDDDFLKFVSDLFPITNDKSDVHKSHVLSLRTDLQTRYMQADDLTKFRKTKWGVINAVSDFAYHSEPIRKSICFQDNNFSQILDGSKILNRATFLLNRKDKIMIR